LKAKGGSDVKRWQKTSSFYESWDERTLQLVAPILDHSKVLEFGAGRLVVEAMLPEHCVYLHSDIVKRREDTLVIDLNAHLPSLPKVDYIVFSGVLEYVSDIDSLITHCEKFTDHILMSYAITDNLPTIKERRYNGWISDLSENDILNLVEKYSFSIETIGVWKKQHLYHLRKKN
jgi:hypothetical protein